MSVMDHDRKQKKIPQTYQNIEKDFGRRFSKSTPKFIRQASNYRNVISHFHGDPGHLHARVDDVSIICSETKVETAVLTVTCRRIDALRVTVRFYTRGRWTFVGRPAASGHRSVG